MAQYIDKAALVAKIMNRIKELQNLHKENEVKLDFIQKTAIRLCIDECKVILSLIDTLEVKEIGVDIGSPEGDMCVKTFWDGDKIVSNKTQKGEQYDKRRSN